MISEIKETIKTMLEAAISSGLKPLKLDIPVEIPSSIEDYKLSHPIGSCLIVYKGSVFSRRDITHLVMQARDVEIMVVITARYRSGFPPEDYLDFVIKALSGKKPDTDRQDRMIYCKQDEWLGEEAGIWSYAATFSVPSEFIQTV